MKQLSEHYIDGTRRHIETGERQQPRAERRVADDVRERAQRQRFGLEPRAFRFTVTSHGG